jgi:valyl-tRNA synthetase
MQKDFPKKYNPKDFENILYENWENKGLFKAKPSKTGDTYSISMPPPNVT